MARKSAAQLQLENAGLAASHPEKEFSYPAEIKTAQEKKIYKTIYDENPSKHLFTEATVPLLVQMVRHVVTSNRIADAMRDTDDVRTHISLASAQRQETAAMASLSVKLKLSASAISDHRGNLKPKSKSKPWEWTDEH